MYKLSPAIQLMNALMWAWGIYCIFAVAHQTGSCLGLAVQKAVGG